jgi:hypothetical protein
MKAFGFGGRKVSRLMQVLGAVVVGALIGGGGIATAAALIDSADVKDNSLQSRDMRDGSLRCKDLTQRLCGLVKTGAVDGAQGLAGSAGTKGETGETGDKGDQGDAVQTAVTSLPSNGFSVTNPSAGLTPDGVEFGPYADGGAAGGSLRYDGLNGQSLSTIKSLLYKARYTSDGDTGGVGVPYLRIFLEGDHDLIFSPNTQPPDSDTGEGPFHTWAATSGLWRYDDDGGSGGDYGVNGVPFMQAVGDHGSQKITGIYVSTGFSAGTNLSALVQSFEVNHEQFVFGG